MNDMNRALAGTTAINRTTGLASAGGQFTEAPRLPAEDSVSLQFTKGTSLNDARTLAVKMMAAHNLADSGWTFAFDNANYRLGQTNYQNKTITLGRSYVLAADTDSITQTMLHEIGHAHAGPGHGHGIVWKRAAAAIGYEGGRAAEHPGSTRKDEMMLAAARLAAKTVEQVISGPLRTGERVESLTGQYTGLLISVARVNATIFCDQTQTQVLIRFAHLRRPTGAVYVAPDPVKHVGPRARVGDWIISASGRRGKVTKVGRTRYHFLCADGDAYSALFSSCALV